MKNSLKTFPKAKIHCDQPILCLKDIFDWKEAFEKELKEMMKEHIAKPEKYFLEHRNIFEEILG